MDQFREILLLESLLNFHKIFTELHVIFATSYVATVSPRKSFDILALYKSDYYYYYYYLQNVTTLPCKIAKM